MTRHGTGCYTSQAAMKRWNRKNEQLAAAAERASVAADWLGGAVYPKEKLTEAWVRFLWHNFHDDLTGTSTPLAYPFSWNDELISQNAFAAVLGDAAGAVARALDTRAEGTPLVVFNPLSFEREDVVEATVRAGGAARQDPVRVFGPDGRETPSQVIGRDGEGVRILFLAKVPSVGFAVYDVRRSDTPCRLATGLAVDGSSLGNGRYQVTLDANGDVASVRDRSEGRELLSGPARLQLLNDTPDQWPEWEISWADIIARSPRNRGGAGVRPRRRAGAGPGRHRGDPQGGRLDLHAADPARGGGAAGTVEFDTRVDWQTSAEPAEGGVPARGGQPEGDLRPRPRHDRAGQQPREPVRGSRAAVGRHHGGGRGPRRRDPERFQVRLGQAGGRPAAVDPDPQSPRDREGPGTAPVPLRAGRARRGLAGRGHCAARGAPQPAARRLPGARARRPPRQELLAAPREQPPGPGQRPEEVGGGGRADRPLLRAGWPPGEGGPPGAGRPDPRRAGSDGGRKAPGRVARDRAVAPGGRPRRRRQGGWPLRRSRGESHRDRGTGRGGGALRPGGRRAAVRDGALQAAHVRPENRLPRRRVRGRGGGPGFRRILLREGEWRPREAGDAAARPSVERPRARSPSMST